MVPWKLEKGPSVTLTVSPTKEWNFVFLLHGIHLVDAAEDSRHLLRTQGRGIHLAAVLLGIAEETQHIGSITNYNRNLTYERGFHQHIARI